MNYYDTESEDDYSLAEENYIYQPTKFTEEEMQDLIKRNAKTPRQRCDCEVLASRQAKCKPCYTCKDIHFDECADLGPFQVDDIIGKWVCSKCERKLLESRKVSRT